MKALALALFGLLTWTASAQLEGDFRSNQSGDWDAPGTWEQWTGSQWITQNEHQTPGEVVIPVDIFPVVAGTSTSAKTNTNNQAHVITLPSGIEAGDLLLIFWADANNSSTQPTLSGWTELASSNANTASIYRKIWYRIATGTEGSSVSTNSFGDRSAHVVYRIAKDTYTGTPFVSSAGNGTNNAPNPPNLNPGQGSQKFLWIASAQGSRTGTVTAPTGFSGTLDSRTNNSNNSDIHSQVTTATRELEANQLDPGSFSRQRTATHTAWTVAIQGFSGTQSIPNPLVMATAQGVQSASDVQNHTISIPAGSVGDLLVTIFSSDGNVTTSTTSTGWTKLGDHSHPGGGGGGGGGNQPVTGSVYWKLASGSTAGADALIVRTSANERSSHITYRIKGATGISGTAANGNNANSNPPNHAAGEDSWLWIATRSGDGTTVATSAPTNYTNLITQGAGNNNGASTNSAIRLFGSPQSSENPGNFTSGTEQWVSWTLAIHGPAPVISYTPIDPPVLGSGSDYPVVAGTASSAKTNTFGATHTVSLPSGIQAGDLLLIFWADANTSGNNPATPTGWTSLYSGQWPSSNIRYRGFYRIANGTEGTSVNITSAAERSAHTAYRIAAGTYQGVPVVSAGVTGTTNSNPDPDNLVSGFGNVPTLWIAAAHITGTVWVTPPANYGNMIDGYSGSVGVDHARTATATRELTAASENPGAFTIDVDHSWGAYTVAIQGVPANIVTVRNGHAVTVSGNNSADKVMIEDGASLDIDGGTLTVNGSSLVVDGTLSSDADKLILGATSNTALSVTGTGSIDVYDLTANTSGGVTISPSTAIRGTLQLNDGTFTATGNNVTLVSTEDGTARLGPVGANADYSGVLKVERYIPAGRTNWRMLGSPVAGRTIANWQDDFLTAGYPGSHYPYFDDPVGSGILWPSIRWYDETVASADPDDGVVGVTGHLQPLSAGQGFLAWCGDNFSTTTAFTVDLRGEPIIAKTPLALPMSRTNTGNAAADGWNMVSNPLPSPIDFTQISRGFNVQNAYWIFDPVAGTNRVWSAGVGQGTVNGVIQSSQGFWLKANGNSYTTTVSETAKVNEPVGGTFGGHAQPALPILGLKIDSDVNTYSDEATIVFADGSPEYEGNDALKLSFHTKGAPGLGILSADGHELAIDFRGEYQEDIQIPLRVVVEQSGTYTITAMPSGTGILSCITLVDQETGAVTPMIEGATYSFVMNVDAQNTDTRFVITATKPLPFIVDNALCHGGEGAGTVVSNEGPLHLNWTDAFGNTLLSMDLEDTSNDVFQFNAVAGNYMVYASPAGACGEVYTNFTITEPAPLEIDAEVDAASCAVATDGRVELTVMGGTAPYTYAWGHGAQGAEVEVGAGEYTVVVTDNNGCILPYAVNVSAGVGPVALFELDGEEAMAGTTVHFLNNTTGAEDYLWNFGDGSISLEESPGHTWEVPGTYEVTLTATSGDCSDVFSLELAVSANTSVTEVTGQGDVSAWATPEQIIIEHNFGNGLVDVDVYDATGRLAISRTGLSQPGQITLDNTGLEDGVWFVRVTSGEVQRTIRVPLVR